MQRLFVKIFLWFWATVVLTGITLVLAFALQPQSVPSHWQKSLEDTTRYFGSAAVETFEQGDVTEPTRHMHRHFSMDDAHVRACLFDAVGKPLAGQDCAEFSKLVTHIISGRPRAFEMRRGLVRMAIPIQGASGRSYIYSTELLAGPSAAFGLNPMVVLLRAGLALFVSGIVCYFLTRYLTKPILRLRSAAQEIAAGQLSVRADTVLELRRDEFGDLVRDFNRMASKTENLISTQRQLLNDVSHELRSPLARINVALDLLRRRSGEDPALDRMESDVQRLNEMIGRLLTVARLEAASTLQNSVQVNLSGLVSSIAGDAEFEAQQRGCHVDIVQEANLAVMGDPSLLRSAIENVLRNAVRFTAAGTAVEVNLRENTASENHEAIIVVRDHGPGVPETELTQIFKPFYRLDNPGDANSTGAGLGLAIAKRIVRFHGGTIRAVNDPGGGLSVEMILPSIHASAA
ncbi:ATP-binding protein [Edaphobacter dinghuensis]|uniref:histidine kinase n=1 Tax=Edaphobacter dinghuensis TaxID=1560005 RepID=A0A917HKW8_9BACT|nr:ATP-binding protein [Edaphobacter dinghuensis]GGG81995.1 two-component sensor histidine kinase [Edaphobacter dinghuensis]